MGKIIRVIRLLFLLFAVLALNIHMIIPHDHHTFESLTNQDERCPLNHSKSSHHPVFPVHCHACNDLTTEKALSLDIVRNIQDTNFITTGIFDLTVIKNNTAGIGIYLPNLPFISPTSDLSLLRAPPSLG